MGKYAQYRKRGTASLQGFLRPPGPADWSAAGTGISQVTATKTISIPAGADTFAASAQLDTGGALTQGVYTNGNVSAVNGLLGSQNYNVRVAWFLGLARVSDWSTTKPAVTL